LVGQNGGDFFHVLGTHVVTEDILGFGEVILAEVTTGRPDRTVLVRRGVRRVAVTERLINASEGLAHKAGIFTSGEPMVTSKFLNEGVGGERAHSNGFFTVSAHQGEFSVSLVSNELVRSRAE